VTQPETPAEMTALARAHPLALFGLDALLIGAARLRPKAVAICDCGQDEESSVTYEELELLIGAFSERLRELDFGPGVRALLCCAPRIESIVAFGGLVACGVEPILAPLNLDAAALAEAARAARAQALFSPTTLDGLDFETLLFEIAEQAPGLRVIGALSGPLIDGAADFTAPALRGVPPASGAPGVANPRLDVGFLGRDGALDFWSENALLAAALDYVRLTRRSADAPIFCLLAPSTYGGLVAGPLAALLAGAPLNFVAPFSAPRFLRRLDAIGPARLVAPASTYCDFLASGALGDGSLLACALVSQSGAPPLAPPPDGLCPIVEIAGPTMRVLTSRAAVAPSRVA